MNPILKLLLGPQAGMLMMGDGRPDNSPGDLSALVKAYAAERARKSAGQFSNAPQAAASPVPPPAGPVPISGPDTPAPSPFGQGAGKIPFLNSPFGQMLPQSPTPGASAAPPSAPAAQPSVPLPMPRPAEAPQAQPDMSFFQRNAAMMRDPSTGDFIDPSGAAQAQTQLANGPTLISKMMTYLHNKDMG